MNIVQINGKFIEWKHIRDLYQKLHSMAVKSDGLSLVPKPKMEHVELTSFSRMRVDLAAQVSKYSYYCVCLTSCKLTLYDCVVLVHV